MARPKQEPFSGMEPFDQKRVGRVETWIDKCDSTREGIREMKKTLKTQEYKLGEAMHASEADVDHQESEDGDKLLVYKRGDYKAVVKRGREVVNYKRGKESKGDPADEPNEE